MYGVKADWKAQETSEHARTPSASRYNETRKRMSRKTSGRRIYGTLSMSMSMSIM